MRYWVGEGRKGLCLSLFCIRRGSRSSLIFTLCILFSFNRFRTNHDREINFHLWNNKYTIKTRQMFGQSHGKLDRINRCCCKWLLFELHPSCQRFSFKNCSLVFIWETFNLPLLPLRGRPLALSYEIIKYVNIDFSPPETSLLDLCATSGSHRANTSQDVWENMQQNPVSILTF